MLLYPILGGALAMGSFVLALFFLRFWKNTNDVFFIYFTAAFTLEGLSWILFLDHQQRVNDPVIYSIRLFAYLLILIAIVGKNKQATKRNKSKVLRGDGD